MALYRRLADETAQYVADRSDRINFDAVMDAARRFYRDTVDAYERLVAQGEVDPRTVVVFLRALADLKQLGSYRALMRSLDDAPLDAESPGRWTSVPHDVSSARPN